MPGLYGHPVPGGSTACQQAVKDGSVGSSALLRLAAASALAEGRQ